MYEKNVAGLKCFLVLHFSSIQRVSKMHCLYANTVAQTSMQHCSYRLYSINSTYLSLQMSEPPHPHGNFVLANYLLLDNKITIVVEER